MSESASNSRRQSAIRYIAYVSGMSEKQAELLIDQLEKQKSPLPGQPENRFKNGMDQHQMLRLLYAAIDSAEEMILITDARDRIGDEKIIYVNKGLEKVTGYSREELIGENPRIFQGPDTEPETIERLRERLSAGKRFEGETFNYRKDGSKYRVRWSIDPIKNSDGEITHFISVQQDVTPQWEQKERLEKIVEERESLLKEIHHRVKNNLAVITGLLELQSANTNSEETQNILTESINRIQSIATLHEKLYETGDYSNISLPDYISGLLHYLIQTMNAEGRDITLDTDIADITLPVTRAVPLALILNELVTNSYKHGFEGRDEGHIWVSLNEDSGNLVLTVADDGAGLPDDLEIEQLQSLGLRLISTLCTQLEGEYTFTDRDPGTKFRLVFPLSV
ncbi:sensor histidine kinase [Halalkalibaculum sp. DA384]|uniref:sensor histidine kinase n=1 Tax=Halalkalibaculum sp. DA384 TaxID=3373606 RepID=UPI0037546C05